MSERTILLGDAATIVDCEHMTAPASKPGDEYAYSIGTRDLVNGRINFASAKRVDESTYTTWTQRAIPKQGDLVLAREAPVGQVALIKEPTRICLGQRTVLIRVHSDDVDSRYLHYRMLGPDSQNWMIERSTGSTVAHLNVADVRALPLANLPPLEEQRRIAGVLGALDDLIDTNMMLFNDIAQISRTAFRRVRRSADDLVPVGEVAAVNELSTKPSTGDIRYIDIASLNDGGIEWPEPTPWTDAPSRARRRASPGCTLWSAVRPNRRGHSLLVNVTEDLVVSTGIGVLTPKRVGPAFLYAATDSQEFVDQLVSMATGSAYPAVNASDFAKALIPLPDREKLDQFERSIWPLWQTAAELQAEIADATKARDELLPLLVSGRVRVRDLEGAV